MHASGRNGDNEYDERESLDEEFPLGDGTADLDAIIECPYCGESVELTLDPGSGPEQDYVEDCEVCCKPIEVLYTIEEDTVVEFEARVL